MLAQVRRSGPDRGGLALGRCLGVGPKGGALVAPDAGLCLALAPVVHEALLRQGRPPVFGPRLATER